MYKDKGVFKKFKKKIMYGLLGNKVIFKNWDDVEGIRDTLKTKKIQGIIISGSDYFIKAKEHSTIDECIINSNIPILAICYGFQCFVNKFGRSSYIKKYKDGYRKYSVSFSIPEPFYIPKNRYIFLHTDYIVKVPKIFKIIKKLKNKIVIAYNCKRNILAVQFHPEKNKKTCRSFLNMWINNCILQQRK